jgi:hypothetical protein
MNMSNHTEDETKKILVSSTYGTTHANPAPEVSPKANFASVTLVFLEDWQNGRLNSDEVCETLLAAAVARSLIKNERLPATSPATTKPTRRIEIDVEKFNHMVETAQMVLQSSLYTDQHDVNAHEFAELFLHFAKTNP